MADWDEEEENMELDVPKIKLEDLLPTIHIAEAAIHSRLQLFSQIALCCPNVIQEVCDFYENEEHHPLARASEMVSISPI